MKISFFLSVVKPDPPTGVKVRAVKGQKQMLNVSWSYPSSWKHGFYVLNFQLRYRPQFAEKVELDGLYIIMHRSFGWNGTMAYLGLWVCIYECLYLYLVPVKVDRWQYKQKTVLDDLWCSATHSVWSAASSQGWVWRCLEWLVWYCLCSHMVR